jgi:ketosteroid isomerase-like protein
MDTDAMKTAARRVLEEVFPAQDDAALGELISPDFVNHEAPPGTPPGPGSVSFFMHMLGRAFSGQSWTVHHLVAEGDMVALYCTHSGRHTGQFFDLAPSGNTFSYRQMHLLRMRDGRAVEHWAVRDDASLMRQLTAAESPMASESTSPGARVP